MAKILVVEDDRKISLALTVRLKSRGHEVVTAYDTLGGVQTAVKHRPDLILMDISMPAGGGFTAAERIQGLAPTAGTPMIFMTASKDPELKAKAFEAGAVAYFEKPYEAEALLKTIDQALNGTLTPSSLT